MENDSNVAVSVIYDGRSKILSSNCGRSGPSVVDITSYAPMNLINSYPWLAAALYPVESQSVMYCAVPKIASKTLVSLMMYVYIRDIIEHLSNNSTNTTINRHWVQQHINIPVLAAQLEKNGIAIPNTNEPTSLVSLLHRYLHILRFESIDNTSPSVFFNPWRLSLKDIFPDIHFKSLPKVANLFSPSFTRAMFVRHPFERLASAYKERIATLSKDRIQPEPHYDSVRKMICRRYGGVSVGYNPLLRINACDNFIPSFEHFVRYILTNTETPVGIARMDGHWKPYAVVCQVCQFKYNFIGKYETFNDDFASLLKRLNVSDWNNQKRRGASGHTTRDYQQLFSSLPDDLICRLKRLYNDDFRLFNYRVEEYVNRTTVIC